VELANHLLKQLCTLLGLRERQVQQALKLREEGATLPFIARYRKEATGNMDEVQLRQLFDAAEELETLEKRRAFILEQAKMLGKLSPELEKAIREATDLHTLEDLYLPFKPRKRSRADAAREKGLEPLAKLIYEQKNQNAPLQAKNYLNADISEESAALAGARDIIAEWISEDSSLRSRLRGLFRNQAVLNCKVTRGKKDKEGAAKYTDYFDFSESLKKCPSHRLLAMLRGEEEGFLKLHVTPDETDVTAVMKRHCLHGYGDATDQVKLAMSDSWERLLHPAMERESIQAAKEKADEDAIAVFAMNAKQLLLAAPLGEKGVLAIDPGFRTGCKAVCLNKNGDLLLHGTIYPHEPKKDESGAARMVRKWLDETGIRVMAIGNGTAGRETADFIHNLNIPGLEVYMVNEAGASIYSASEVAAEEFPELDLTFRGAVSIGRRLQDPLAELVKIDPKNIGVGQYQHDVNQSLLRKRLDAVVESAVNSVGVNLNTASRHLLAYVSGIGPQTARNITEYRSTHGPFTSRKQLMEIPRLGAKVFEQCAGFLRIREAENPLDNSAVHPERYSLVQQMARDLSIALKDLSGNEQHISRIKPERYVQEDTQLGLLTIMDILSELRKPGLDPRGEAKAVTFDATIRSIEQVEAGMELQGIVSNITDFGAFVDIGVKQDGLVHISQIADRFIRHPSEVLKLGEEVRVRVLDVDLARRRIQLTMKFR
jgi:uncharacterized protein